MRPRFPRTVTVRTPSPSSVDPATGNTVPGTPVDVSTPAYLAQQSVSVLSSYVEINGRQDTTISLFTLLVPPDVVLTDKSQVIDEQGNVYRINGSPAERRGLGRRVLFRAASMHLVSDLQPQEP